MRRLAASTFIVSVLAAVGAMPAGAVPLDGGIAQQAASDDAAAHGAPGPSADHFLLLGVAGIMVLKARRRA